VTSVESAYKIKDSALHCLWKVRTKKEIQRKGGDKLIMLNLLITIFMFSD